MSLTFQIQWQLDGVDVPGQTGNQFRAITTADRGKRVGFRLIATGSNGLPSGPVYAPPVLVPTVGPALTISGTPSNLATVGVAYSFTPSAAGGTAPYTFSMPSGTLPTGLSFNVSTGAITGTPTTAQTQANLVIRVTDQKGATADLPAFSITVSAVSVKLSPSTGWNGTAGSGFGGAHAPIPTDPTRVTAKPWCKPLFKNWQTITGDQVIGFDAGNMNGSVPVEARRVIFNLEGNEVTVTAPSLHTYVDVNGVTRSWFGFAATFDYATWLALSASGTANLYVTAVPANDAMQNRVMGPYTFYARATEFTQTKTVGASGKDYTTIKDALTYCRTNPTERVNIVLSDTANYKIDAQASTFATPKWWTVISAANGVSATIGDGTLVFTQPAYDGLEFRGSGIKWDVAQLGYNISSAYRFSNGTSNRLWLNGTDGPYCGAANPAHGGSGSGAAALINGNQPGQFWIGGNDPTTAWNVGFQDLAAHDLPAYGLSFCSLRLNCSSTNISGSDGENALCVHGGYSDQVGGYYNGLRTYQGAFDLTGPAGSAFEKTGANGSSGAFNVYTNFADTVPAHTVAISSTTTVATVIAAINGWSGWTATPTTSTNELSAAYLSLTTIVPSAAIPKTLLSGTASIKRIADIHADVLVWHGNSSGADDVIENVSGRFFENRRSVGTAFGSVNGDVIAKDWGMRNLSNQDISVSLGQATQPGYWGGTRQHVCWQYGSNTNPSGNRFLGDSTSDAYCVVDQWAGPITIAAGTIANQKLSSLACPVLPTGANANSKVVSTNQALLYTAPTANPPNFTPLSVLALADSSYAGRYLPTGAEQGV